MPDLRVCVDVPDLSRAIAFYEAALGFRLRRRLGDEWAAYDGIVPPLDPA